MEVNFAKQYLFIGNKQGCVTTYQLENYNEKLFSCSNILIKKTLEIKTDPNLRITAVKLSNKNELLIALSNGSIAVYSHDEKYPECI